MEIDHIFMFIEPNGPEIEHFRAAGFTETYRRKHPGQGTENICYCFDNVFFELLWVNNIVDIRSEEIARTRLYERSRWRSSGTNPFGIAWRDLENTTPFEASVWDFKPPYLPEGMSIAVSVDSDDPYQPMIFKSPGSMAPAQWPQEKRGVLQRPAGLGQVLAITLMMPQHILPSRTLQALADRSILKLGSRDQKTFSLEMSIERIGSEERFSLTVPREV